MDDLENLSNNGTDENTETAVLMPALGEETLELASGAIISGIAVGAAVGLVVGTIFKRGLMGTLGGALIGAATGAIMCAACTNSFAQDIAETDSVSGEIETTGSSQV